MKKERVVLKGQEGFTLIEIIAILIILGILAAVAVPKYIDLTSEAEDRAIDAGIAELNGREALTWAKAKISSTGWTADALPDTALGSDYTWDTGDPTTAGGGLIFGGTTVELTRTPSTSTAPAQWTRT